MTKILVLMLLLGMAGASAAHEIRNQAPTSLLGLGQMAKLQAQKNCADRSGRDQSLCEVEQIRSLAETAASLPALRPARLSPAEFATLIEATAGMSDPGGRRMSSAGASQGIDCRVNVC